MNKKSKGRPSVWNDDIPDQIIEYTDQAVYKWEEYSGLRVDEIADGVEIVRGKGGEPEKKVKYKEEVVPFKGTRIVPDLPTVAGLFVYMFKKVDKFPMPRTLEDWSAGRFPDGMNEDQKARFSWSYRYLMNKQEQIIVTNSLAGHFNPAIAKLVLSSHHNYKEKLEVKEEKSIVHLFGMGHKELAELDKKKDE